MHLLPEKDPIRVSVVGLGYVGSCIAATLADRGTPVTGIDVDPRLVQEMNSGHCRFSETGLPELVARATESGFLRVTDDPAAVEESDVVIVAVGTPITERGTLAGEQLRSACSELGRRARPGQLFIFKSTVPPGATRELAIPLLESGGLRCGTDFGVAFCPERLSEGTALSELRSLPMVVGGWCEESTRAAAFFWERALGVTVLPCASLETAETVKLADNWWIDHNIALSNQLARLCDASGVDVLEVIAAANTVPKGSGNVNILLPGVGVGGSCLPKDPWMLWHAGRRHGVDMTTIPVAREANDAMPGFTVRIILDELAKRGRPASEARVAVLGVAFKNNTGDLRATPVEGVVLGLREAGVQIRLHDPLADDEEVDAMFGQTPTASLHEAIDKADCVAVLAWHDDFRDLDYRALSAVTAPGCLLVDGRSHLSREQISDLREQGFDYRGIGRNSDL